MVKNYGIHDEWKDLNKVNDIVIKSVDGVIDSIKVNGEEAGGGGGGGDYPTTTATWHEDTENYTYSCDWSFSELKAKIEEQTENSNWAGIYHEEGADGTTGGTWGVESTSTLTFLMSDGSELLYNFDGTITKGH